MKYDFLAKQIGAIDPFLLDELRAFALDVDYGPNLGFYKGLGIRTHRVDRTSHMLTKLLGELSSYFNPVGYLNSHINILPPMHWIPEHSDVGDDKFYDDNHHIHKVHIPLFSNEQSGHMWRQQYREDRPLVMHLMPGGIYLFNNVDYHSAINLSKEDSRYHWILRYAEDALNV